MRIGIDARFLTHPQRGGFKTYTQSLVQALAQVDQSNEYVLYLDRPLEPQHILPNQPNIRAVVVPGEKPLVGMVWREQGLLAAQARRDRLDVFHGPSLTAPLRLHCPLVVTIHDTIWLFPEQFSQERGPLPRRLMRWYYRLIPEQAARRAAAVITVSQDARQQIVDQLHIRPERITVTYEAASPEYHRIDDPPAVAAVLARYDLQPGYLLALGSADPRKNVQGLLHAYAALPQALRNQHQLAIVWTHQLLADEIAVQARSLGIEQQIRYLRTVPNQDLVVLYNAAGLFVFPSRYEGFGLPLLEAMACGAPVVAANNSSIPEVVGNAALLVDAEQPDQIAAAMQRILTSEQLCHELITRGLHQAAQFSWSRCANETISVYQRACAR